MAGLGALTESGGLPKKGREKALRGLRRFRLLIDHMGIRQTKVVATAAVRDATDGPEFVGEIERLGLKCDVISAQEEARLAGQGVLSGIPEAQGVVGDLGGGSLELVQIGLGAKPGISLPLGVLRLDSTADGEKATRKLLKAALKGTGLREAAEGRCFYMVGGSWRTLARIDMRASDFPLPITQQYKMKPGRIRELRKIISSGADWLAELGASSRVAAAPAAAMLLDILVEELQPARLIVSTYGIREGLLFSRLGPNVRQIDPLIEEARDAGGGEHGFGQHGDLLNEWIAPLFDDEPRMERLRLASCLLADVAWQANPGFRADRAIEMALHGNWVGVNPAGRVIMAQALAANFGRDKLPDPRLSSLCKDGQLKRAHCWGVAMRLGQRLSGGVASVLSRTRLSCDDKSVRLHVARGEEGLIGDAVERRLARLGETLGLKPGTVSGL